MELKKLTDFNKIQQLVKERDEFLAKHPELQPLQDEINDIINKAGNKHNRNVVIQNLMLTRFHEINKLLKNLTKGIK